MKKLYPVLILCLLSLVLLATWYGASGNFYIRAYRSKRQEQNVSVLSSPVASEVSAVRETGGQEQDGSGSPVYYRDKVIALIYHHFASPEESVTISRERLVSHLDLLLKKGYRVIGLEQLMGFWEGRPLPPNAVLITIDDGYSSVYEIAFPELKYRKMPAAVFVIGAYMGKSVNNLRHFGWGEAKEMDEQGITIHSHTYNQHYFGRGRDGVQRPSLEGPLAGETEQEFERQVLEDLAKSRQDLENSLGRKAYALAWPYGRASDKARDIAARLGFRLIFTTQYGVITRRSNPLSLPRINVGTPKVSAADLDLILKQAVGATGHESTGKDREVSRPRNGGGRTTGSESATQGTSVPSILTAKAE
ncbi:MAG: polysaccharide deacetylase family protein [Thermanaeromonas sp.]|uniref:polysaccharide deacetylase family protein n=1 Tax=Thermanaeromonas sp. TaxID=2003697 RepID=UPI00243C4BDB|nr:polysaccharide deacetylase family protein [Thermanaeromonas sp.]MCG0277647.1 polysaccharide deacetylase family protein [Thermanaeromonas sp.]